MRFGWILAVLSLACLVGAQRPIRGGDRLRVECEQEASLNRVVGVSPEGVGSFGILGPLAVQGVAPEALARQLAAMLLARLSLSRADVTVTLLTRDDLPIRYGGAVAHSGQLPPGVEVRLSEIVELAQPSAAADLEAVRILGDDGSERVIDFTRAGEDPERFDPRLRPGDHVFFALARVASDVFVLGGISKPRNVPFADAQTVAAALLACGGLVSHANLLDVSVLRGGTTIRLRLPRDAGFALRRGDTLRVGVVDDRQFVTVAGAVGAPGRVPYFEGMGIVDVLAAAGGPLPIADLSRIGVKAGTGMRRPGLAIGPGDLVEVSAAKLGSGRSFVERLLQLARRIGG